MFKSTRLLLPSTMDKNSHLNAEKLFLKKIDDLERFLRIVTSKQEFWSEFVFDFFLIPAEYLITLLDEKDRFFSQPKSMIYQSSKKRHDSYVRSNSGRNDRSLSHHSIYQIDEEIQEEDDEPEENGKS